jgi:hypothetical protein
MCLELLMKTMYHLGQDCVSWAEIRRKCPDYYRHTNLLDMNICFSLDKDTLVIQRGQVT